MLNWQRAGIAGLALCTVAPAAADPAPDAVLAQAGGFTYTGANLADALAIDAGVLETPLSEAERTRIQEIVVHGFKEAPDKVAKAFPAIHRNAELYRHGSAMEQALAREAHWEAVLKAAPTDRIVAQWLDVMRQHGTVVAEGDGMVVTKPELQAMFASDDIVAEVAGQPKPADSDHDALAAGLPDRFAAMKPEEKARYAHAERRHAALLQNILAYSDLRAKAVTLIKASVHKPEDVAPEARALEDDGMRFAEEIARFNQQQAAIAGLDYKTKTTAEGINFASRKFLGQGP
jgi:hypothetical protein